MGEKARVLVVDDDPLVLRTIQRIVRLRYLDEGATSADEALQRVEQGEIAAVLSDVNMPGKSGLELLNILRARHPSLPVLLMTAKHSREDAERAIASGAIGYLTKPMPSEALLDSVAAALAASPSPSSEPSVAGEHSSQPAV